MKQIKILTQDQCSKCIALKSYLEMGLRNRYADEIEFIHRQENSEVFREYASKYDIMATPVMIIGEDILVDTSPSKVNAFINEHLG